MKYLFLSLLLFVNLCVVLAQPKVGAKAPEIHITNWIKNAPPSKYLKGKFIIVDFWATWCAPCLESVPHMNNLANKNKAKANLVFLAMTDENEGKVNGLLKKVQFNAAVVTDITRQTFDDYKIKYIPLCVMIDDKNMVQWVGNPADLTNQIIDAVMAGKPAPKAEGKQAVAASEEVNELYKSLSSKYGAYMNDQDLKEYFTLTLSPYRKNISSFRNTSKSSYNELVIGDSLANRLASFLNVATTQIKLPVEVAKSYISYCYKSERDVESKQVLKAIIDKINLRYTTADSLMDVIQFEITNLALFEKVMADTSVPKVAHTSNSETYIGIDYDKFEKLVNHVQDKFQKTVVVKQDNLLDTRVSMTIKYDTMANMVESLKAFGINATIIKKNLPVYKFELKS